MLLTVHETAYVLGMNWRNVYYLLNTAQLDGVKIRDNWRVFSDSLEELYDKRHNEELHRDGVSISDGLPGFSALLDNIKNDRLQDVDSRRYSGV